MILYAHGCNGWTGGSIIATDTKVQNIHRCRTVTEVSLYCLVNKANMQEVHTTLISIGDLLECGETQDGSSNESCSSVHRTCAPVDDMERQNF